MSLCLQSINAPRPEAVFFDMDGTLIFQETIDELARLAGVYDQVASITKKAMDGVLNFEQSLLKRVETLRGQPEVILTDVVKNLKVRPGVRELIVNLSKNGVPSFVVSGGFQVCADMIAVNGLGVAEALANQLESKDGVLTGRLSGKIIDEKAKADYLMHTCAFLGVGFEGVYCFGDGANDIEMFKLAGFRVGVEPKKALLPYCDYVLSPGNYQALIETFKEILQGPSSLS